MRSHKPDYLFLGSLAGLLIFGLLMLFSASSPESIAKFGHPYFFIKKQLLLGVLPGLVIFFICQRLNYHFWLKWGKWLFFLALLLLILVLLPGLGGQINRAQSWLIIQGFSFQPAELAKLGLILYLSAWLSKLAEEGSVGWKKQLLPLVVILVLLSGLLLKQPDFGSLMILILLALTIYFIGGGKIAQIAGMIAAGMAAIAGLIIFSPYRTARLMTFLHPELDPQGIGYHINQAFLAIGSGGFWGLGWGHSRQKFQYLPEVSADSIFAVIGEEMGFIFGAIFVIFLCFIFWRGLKIAANAPDTFGKLIAIGVMVWLVGQSFINIAAMIGLLPLTGLPLPLISHGGSAMIVMLGGLGIVANISRQTRQI